MLKHLRIWWRPYACIIIAWMARYFFPPFLQGASSELGQDIYGWLTSFDTIMSGVKLLDWLQGG